MPINNPRRSGGSTEPQESARKVSILFYVASFQAGGTEVLQVPLGKRFVLFKVEASGPAWLRVYQSLGKLQADASRAINLDAQGNHGLVWEGITSSAKPVLEAETEDEPVAEGQSSEDSDLIWVSAKNLSASVQNFSSLFTRVKYQE